MAKEYERKKEERETDVYVHVYTQEDNTRKITSVAWGVIQDGKKKKKLEVITG